MRTVAAGSPADGTRIGDLAELPEDASISLAVRDNRVVPITGTTELRQGDELTIVADHDRYDCMATVFAAPIPPVARPQVVPRLTASTSG